jgi:hypothetical protein
MTEQEFKDKQHALHKKYMKDKAALETEYALSNNTVKVGDVFTDNLGSIKVEKIKVWPGGFSKLPSCVYEGLVLKKDGTPTKRNVLRRNAWQVNKVDNNLK